MGSCIDRAGLFTRNIIGPTLLGAFASFLILISGPLQALGSGRAAQTSASCSVPASCGCCGDHATSPPGLIAFNDYLYLGWFLGATSSGSAYNACFDLTGD